ncbi:hypothetical protein MMC19_005212 [Ptychographa xylographoides]|nr:hypothetical protein [Ptychographa xylographoides]
MAALRAAKAGLRKEVQKATRQLTSEDIEQQSQKIQARLFAMPEYRSAESIGIYLSMPSGEVSTRGIVEDALSKGKRVFVPYLHLSPYGGRSQSSRVMDMVSLLSERDYRALQEDKWGIPTPDESSLQNRRRVLGGATKSISSDDLDMVVMPGVAFDHNRQRLGHGRGFYDFFLHRYQERLNSAPGTDNIEKTPMPYLVGLALQEQLLANEQSVPTTKTDWVLDALILGDGSLLEARA